MLISFIKKISFNENPYLCVKLKHDDDDDDDFYLNTTHITHHDYTYVYIIMYFI